MDYTEPVEPVPCDLNCDEECICQLCSCCSVCADQCSCPAATTDSDEKMVRILKFGDQNYRFLIISIMNYLYTTCHIYRRVRDFYETLVFSDESEVSEIDMNDEEDAEDDETAEDEV